MVWLRFEVPYGLRCLLALAATTAALTFSSDAAFARYVHYTRVAHAHHHSDDYDPPYASIVVDGNSGDILQATNPDALRHPASLTKVMTLYLLFERLDAGKISLDTALKVSQHASDQDPTKLDLKPGDTITVENAIKGIVTRSANDAAVVVAENLGGDETSFAKQMTQKAHALGMAHTTYVNASGLPDDSQITTARDQALLGRAIQDRFPRYYKYFSIESFTWKGEEIRNHDRLLSSVDGVDGIKTGFTQASGFNLLTSVHRDGRFIVAVVMGGYSAGQRDARMRDLINGHIKEAALHRTTPLIADASEHHDNPQPVAFTKTPMVSVPAAASADAVATASVDSHPAANSKDPIRPLLVRTIPYRTAPVQTASLAPMPMLVQVAPPAAPAPKPAAPAPKPPAPAQANVQSPPPAMPAPPAPAPPPAVVASAAPTVPFVDLKAAAQPAAEAAQPEPVQATAFATEPAKAPDPIQVVPAKPNPVAAVPVQTVADADSPPVVPAKAELADVPKLEPATAPPPRAHGGWLIQIGAFEDENDAKQHLSNAQTKLGAFLKAADPFTERILKGAKAYFRARFAGFDRATAEAACKLLKRNDFECMVAKD